MTLFKTVLAIEIPAELGSHTEDTPIIEAREKTI
jgi:hypothetical protein